MPIVRLLGLNSVAVRLPSVLAGSLLVVAIYWLLREFKFTQGLSLFGALIVAFSPWTFMLSRFAYEANIALLFFTLSLTAFSRLVQKRGHWWAVLAAILMSLTWYTYIAFRPVTLLFAVSFLLFLLFSRQIKWQRAILFLVIFIALLAPLFHPSILASSTARFNQIGILADEGLVMSINQNRSFCSDKLPRLVCYSFWNKPLVISQILVRRFMASYSPQFLFTTGNNQLRYQTVEDFGQFYLVLCPLLFLGLVGYLFRVNDQKLVVNNRVFILLGLMIAPVSAILSGEPQMVRFSPAVPFLILTMVRGLEVIWQFLPANSGKKIIGGGLTVAIIFSSLPFLVNYFTIHTVKHDEVYQSYLPELFEVLASYPPQVSVYIRPFFSDPIMAYAYYRQIKPSHYQKNVVLGEKEDSGFQHAVGLDNLRVSDEPMLNLGCRAVKRNQVAYYVTNEEFKRPPIEFLHRVASENGAMYYAYIYNASAYAKQHPELCLD